MICKKNAPLGKSEIQAINGTNPTKTGRYVWFMAGIKKLATIGLARGQSGVNRQAGRQKIK